jgi:hypothetical protein
MTIDEAIQHCEEVADTPCFTDEEAKCYSEHRQLAEWLKELKAYRNKSEIPNKWIPVSERLPDDGEEVLCFLDSEEMAVLFRRNDWGQDEWVDGAFATGSYDVVAWMPLPLPWKGESEVES